MPTGMASKPSAYQQSWPIAPPTGDSNHDVNDRRTRAYDDIMAKWKQFVDSAGPRPRSSHSRVLGGHARTTRQRGESFSTIDTASLRKSWGNLNDTISDGAKSAWREQLLVRNRTRLAGVPIAVLLRHKTRRGAGGYRVVAAAPNLSAMHTARAVVEGRCPEVLTPTIASSSSSSSSSRYVENGGVDGCKTNFGVSCLEGTEVRPPGAGEEVDAAVKGVAAAEVENSGCLGITPSSSSSVGSVLSAGSTWPVKVPVRGFHLVDLHAAVKNYVEWSHCLPKVEPCFRVGDNRDSVLLGLVHSLGARLSCASVHDMKAGAGAAHSIGQGRAPSAARLLDRHVCRSPALLRAGVAAGIRLYEVDCVDEMCRISAARRKARDAIGHRPSDSPKPGGAGAGPSHPRVDVAGPAEVLIRLKIPFRSRHGEPSCSAPSTIEGAPEDPLVEALYGAEAEDMVDLVQAAAGIIGPSEEGEGGTRAAASAFGGDPMVVVGFSIDVGPACWDDAIAAAVSPHGRAGSEPGEAVASAILSESIDAAVTVAVYAARRAVDAAAALAGATGEDVGKARDGVAVLGGPTVVGVPPPPFSFRRLHVTGLGNGGARGQPLTALKAALARRLPTESSGDCDAVGTTVGRPVIVSADATEHLVAGGVWSTVASIIGRKSVVPSTDASSPVCLAAAGGVRTGDGGRDGTNCASLGAVETDSDHGRGGGAMYYIDDGCYGSLSGALLRGVYMQPSPLSRRHSDDLTNEAAGGAKVQSATIGRGNQGPLAATVTATAGAAPAPPAGARVPCTVWGPTCDGLDCVSRVTQLPDDMEPGRDWLFFPDMGMGAGANVTGFNGLKPLDACYCIRREERVAPLVDSVVVSSSRQKKWNS